MMRYSLLIIAVAAVACGDGALGPSAPIEGRAWRLVSLQRGTDIVTVATPDRYVARFENGRVAVQSDCNSCSGPYTLNDGEIRIGALVCTRVFCGPDSLDAEFTRALDAAATALAGEDTLVLHGSEVTLRFSR